MDVTTLLQAPAAWCSAVRENQTYDARAAAVALFSIPSVFWIQAIVKRLHPGAARLAALAPVIIVNFYLPLLFSNGYEEFLTRGIVVFAYTWLANFKAIGLAMGRGEAHALCGWMLFSAPVLTKAPLPCTAAHRNRQLLAGRIICPWNVPR